MGLLLVGRERPAPGDELRLPRSRRLRRRRELRRSPSLDFQGLSFSVYDRKARCWKQTWVDSHGTYLDFTGGFADGVMELRREGELDDAGSLFRMRWGEHRTRLVRLVVAALGRRRRNVALLWEIEYTRVV
jgi:hypothetical protein